MDIKSLKEEEKVHFIGIGGIGMSALALILRDFGVEVQGSDLGKNYLTEKIISKGIRYFIGHNSDNITKDTSLVIKTSTILDNNPEIIAAKLLNIPIITRANLLGIILNEFKAITVAGTHGKTSTTAIIANIIENAGMDPMVINGGVMNNYSSNYKIGKGEYAIAESDESDGSFVKLPSYVGVITNIEPEHLEFYQGSFEKQKSYFVEYIKNIHRDGIVAMNIDDPEVKIIHQNLGKENMISYSISQEADIVAKNISHNPNGNKFDVAFKNGREFKNIQLPAYGNHNISNSLAAIAVADFLNIKESDIRKGLASFKGVKRRFTHVGDFNGVKIIDDYAHHPTEISVTLDVARQIAKNNQVICIFQPHKYQRVKDLFEEFCNCFKKADYVIVCEIFSANYQPIKGITQEKLVEGIKENSGSKAIKLSNPKDISDILTPIIKPDDLILFLGAGDITNWAYELAKK